MGVQSSTYFYREPSRTSLDGSDCFEGVPVSIFKETFSHLGGGGVRTPSLDPHMICKVSVLRAIHFLVKTTNDRALIGEISVFCLFV